MAILNCGKRIPGRGEQLPLCFDLKEASELHRLGCDYAVASEIPVTEELYAYVVAKLSSNKQLRRALGQITTQNIKTLWSKKFGKTNNPFTLRPSWLNSVEMIVTPCIYKIERDEDFEGKIFCISVKLPLEAKCFDLDYLVSESMSRTEEIIRSLVKNKNLTIFHNEIRFHFQTELVMGKDGKYNLVCT